MLTLYETKPELKSQELLNRINEMRQALIDHGLIYGFTDPSTVTLSQQLDKLLNEFQICSR